ncbi:MAG: DinB family protein [Pseudomonadales bacterium]|nr:DinB family protein [Pseudomonadales bacterium]
MSEVDNLALLADYNRWMNQRLYALAGELDDTALQADRGAFFGSVFGTLSHLAVADTIWMRRYATHPAGQPLAALLDEPAPTSLDARPWPDLPALRARREWLDGLIMDWVATLTPQALDRPLAYRNVKGEAAHRRLGSLLVHFFNHQTHHRGQLTTLLSQMGMDAGVTDLLVRISDEPER